MLPIVEYDPSVKTYLASLIDLLFEKGYFGFRESAKSYVNALISDIETLIHLKSSKPAPDYFLKYGKHLSYTIFHFNKRTSWYVFFLKKDNRYLITHITNNHVAAQYFTHQNAIA